MEKAKDNLIKGKLLYSVYELDSGEHRSVNHITGEIHEHKNLRVILGYLYRSLLRKEKKDAEKNSSY